MTSRPGRLDALPRALSPLLGRERELVETEELLAANRLLTITGAGGSGKTRLALELAQRVRSRFADDVFWIDLAPIADAAFIPPQIMAALSIRTAAQAPLEILLEWLEERSALLVIDNCEHLVAACAAVADSILRTCPRVTMLATSREPLGIEGEQAWLVPPLAEADAVALFRDRAYSASTEFRLTDESTPTVAAICARLDGIPLSIELAAARIRFLSADQILERLDDAFGLLTAAHRSVARHRTIRETIEWSYRLLTDDEQLLLGRLGVFSGSFSLTATEAVCGEAIEVMAVLAALVDKSLVVVDRSPSERRYRLLDTVRQFAVCKLEEGGDRDRLRARHAQFFLALAESFEESLFAGASDRQTISRIDDEISNLRSVFDWAAENRVRTPVALRLIYALHWYWFARAHFHEAQRRIDEYADAIRQPGETEPEIWARARVATGHVGLWKAEWSELASSVRDAAGVLRASDDRRAFSGALLLLGVSAAFVENDPAAAFQLFQEAKKAATQAGCQAAEALALYWCGLAAAQFGQFDAARSAFREAHRIGKECGHKPGIAHPLTVLGQLALYEGNLDEAICCFERALDVHAEIDDRWGLTQVIEGVGLILVRRGDAVTGVRLLAGASAAWLQLGARPGHDTSNEDKEQIVKNALADSTLRAAVASGAAMSYHELVDVARERLQELSSKSDAVMSGSNAPRLQIRALGSLEVVVDGQRFGDTARSTRWLELLLYLADHPRGATKRQVGAALWPDADSATLRNNFHVTLHRLRRALGDREWVIVDGDTYRLDSARGVEFDASIFESSVRSTLPLVERDAASAETLAEVVERYGGDFLPNVTAGEWQSATRTRLREQYADALRVLGRARMSSGDFRRAAGVYERLIALDSLDEQAYRNLMTCHARAGELDASDAVYRRLTTALQRELQADPDPVTARLHERIVTGQLL